jgi:dipeptidyl aminopeptidase/acylaminoacyl peptidase
MSPGAACASVTSKDLVELTDIDGLSISPDGRFAIFRTDRADVGRNTYILRWYSVDLGNGTVRDIGSGGDPIYITPGLLQAETPVWAADNRTIIVRALVDGAVGLWRADVAGHGMTPLVVGDADVADYSITPDHTALLYKTGATRDAIRRAEQREYDNGILVDSSVDLGQNLFRGGSINGRMSSQRLIGFWFVRGGLLWRAPQQQRRIDLRTLADVAVGAPQAVPPFTLPRWPPPISSLNSDGDMAVARWDGDKKTVTATLVNGRQIVCADPVCATQRVSSLIWRPGSHDVLVTFKDRELRQSLYLWDIGTNRAHLVAHQEGLLNGGRNNSLPCAVSARLAICVASGPASPPRLERIDFESSEQRVMFDPNEALRSAYHPQIRFLRWSIGDGQEAAGVLMQPSEPGKAAAPLFLNYNFCEGFLRGGVGDEWPIPELLNAGYAVGCINSVPLASAQDAVQNYRFALAAVRTLIDRLSNERVVDRSKVAMGGLSFGSEAAFWVAFHSNLLAALSVTAPQPESTYYWFSSMPGSDIPATIRRVWGYGAPEETPRRWRIISPALNADKIRIPVLFQMPEMEARRVPELYARLAREGTPTELYAFPDEDHIKIQPRHRLAVYERNLDWFRYWLEDYRDPDREKADQYRRWDQLRSRSKSSPAPTATSEATTPARPSR